MRSAAKAPTLPFIGAFILLTVPIIFLFETIYGQGRGLIVTGVGVLLGASLAAITIIFKWDWFAAIAALLATYFLLGGYLAIPQTLSGPIPTWNTLQSLLFLSVDSWKDLLTVELPAGRHTGPAVMGWLLGLLVGYLAYWITIGLKRPLLGTLPIIVFGIVAIAWGPKNNPTPLWAVALWVAMLMGWWSWSIRNSRIDQNSQVQMSVNGQATSRSLRRNARNSRFIFEIVAALAVTSLIAVPVVALTSNDTDRTVLRQVVEPPLELSDYASPLSAFRYYTTTAKENALITVENLPSGSRVRLAVMDYYDGNTFGLSSATDQQNRSFRTYVGGSLASSSDKQTGETTTVGIKTGTLSGPWLPSVSTPVGLALDGDSTNNDESLFANKWSQTFLTTKGAANLEYQLEVRPRIQPAEGELKDVPVTENSSIPDVEVPAIISELASKLTASESSSLGKIRAIEQYLSNDGYFSNANTENSRPGHRADRLERMVSEEQLIGDDEQYAALMTLMLHSLDIPARVVMGAYPKSLDASAVTTELLGADVHAWVEVEFEGLGWVEFDPTPPSDVQPETESTETSQVARPQVLQPPEPPDEPADPPEATTDEDLEEPAEQAGTFPWRTVITGVGVAVVVALPFLAIILVKNRRTSRRRNNKNYRESVLGAWMEITDLATDSGIKISNSMARQETVIDLSEKWDQNFSGNKNKKTTPINSGVISSPNLTNSPFATRVRLPRLQQEMQQLALVVDAGLFAAENQAAPTKAQVWAQADQVQTLVQKQTKPLGRLIRRLSVKSLFTTMFRSRKG